jgi:hypothetical protein
VSSPCVPAQPPRLLDQFRLAARARGHSAPTTDALACWVRAFILFHDKQHPSTLSLPHVTRFLEHVVKTEPDPLPALAMARCALSMLYSACSASTSASCPSRHHRGTVDGDSRRCRTRSRCPRNVPP